MTKPLLIMFPKKVNKQKALEFIDKYFKGDTHPREIFELGYKSYGKDGPFYIREGPLACFVYGNMRAFAQTLHNGAGYNVVYYDCDKILIGDLQ